MLSKITVIGIGAGIVISSIGIFALVTSLGTQEFPIDEIVEVGDFSSFQFTAPAHTDQSLLITGKSFNLKLTSPGRGLQIPEKEHKDEVDLQFTVIKEGEVKIFIQNTGDSPLELKGTIRALNDPILFTYHIMVIIAGVVIIGFSGAFSIRKPRGF